MRWNDFSALRNLICLTNEMVCKYHIIIVTTNEMPIIVMQLGPAGSSSMAEIVPTMYNSIRGRASRSIWYRVRVRIGYTQECLPQFVGIYPAQEDVRVT